MFSSTYRGGNAGRTARPAPWFVQDRAEEARVGRHLRLLRAQNAHLYLREDHPARDPVPGLDQGLGPEMRLGTRDPRAPDSEGLGYNSTAYTPSTFTSSAPFELRSLQFRFREQQCLGLEQEPGLRRFSHDLAGRTSRATKRSSGAATRNSGATARNNSAIPGNISTI